MPRGMASARCKPEAPVETNTPFAAGSVTKQFTCACIFLLAEDGKLSVRDPVAKWYPGPDQGERDHPLRPDDARGRVSRTTTRSTSSTGGWRSRSRSDDLLKEYAGGKLDFDPGVRWSYSNTGFILLGRVIEKVSGKSFAEFLSERILKPLEMTDTIFDPKPDQKGLATGYTAFALGDPEPAVARSRWLDSRRRWAVHDADGPGEVGPGARVAARS